MKIRASSLLRIITSIMGKGGDDIINLLVYFATCNSSTHS